MKESRGCVISYRIYVRNVPTQLALILYGMYAYNVICDCGYIICVPESVHSFLYTVDSRSNCPVFRYNLTGEAVSLEISPYW